MSMIELAATAEDARCVLEKVFLAPPHSCGAFYGVRKIRKGRHGVRVTYFTSKKNKGAIPCESEYLEAATCRMLEIDERVSLYRSQPVVLALPEGRSYTPDFAAQLVSGQYCLLECKMSPKLRSERVQRTLECARVRLEELGMSFRILTEHDCQPEITKLKAASHGLANARIWCLK